MCKKPEMKKCKVPTKIKTETKHTIQWPISTASSEHRLSCYKPLTQNNIHSHRPDKIEYLSQKNIYRRLRWIKMKRNFAEALKT